jgi:hypothetical protein
LGDCKSIADLKKQLRQARYSLEKITGRTLFKQLAALIKAARGGSYSPERSSGQFQLFERPEKPAIRSSVRLNSNVCCSA